MQENKFSLLLYRSNEDHISESIVTKDFKVFVQNGYLTFYDNEKRLVSCMFPSQKDLHDFLKKVAIVKFASSDMREIVSVDLAEGNGEALKVGDSIGIKYTGNLLVSTTPLPSIGQQFDSNKDKDSILKFKIGQNTMIKGMETGVVGMKMNGNASRFIIIPSFLAYGEKGAPPSVPPNSNICFSVEILKAKKGSESSTPQPQSQSQPALDALSETDALSGIHSIHSEDKGNSPQNYSSNTHSSKSKDHTHSHSVDQIYKSNPGLSLIADSTATLDSPASQSTQKSKNKSKKNSGKAKKQSKKIKKETSSEESDSESDSSNSSDDSFSEESVNIKKSLKGKKRKKNTSDSDSSIEDDLSEDETPKKSKKSKDLKKESKKDKKESKKDSKKDKKESKKDKKERKEYKSMKFDIPVRDQKVSGDTLSILQKLTEIEDKIENLDISNLMKTKTENKKMLFMSGTVLMQNVQHFITENEALKNDLSEERQKVDQLIEQMKELKERNNSLTKHSFTFSEDENFLQGELMNAKKQVKTQQSSIIQLTNDLEKTIEERNQLKVENESLNQKLDESIQAKRYSEVRAGSLENDFGKMNQKLRELLEQIEISNRKNEELLEENRSKSEEINKLQNKINAEIKAKENTQSLLTDSQQTIRELLDDRENSGESIKILQSKLQEIAAERDEYQQELEQNEIERENLLIKFKGKLEEVQKDSQERAIEDATESVKISMRQVVVNMKERIANPEGLYKGDKIIETLLFDVRNLTSKIIEHVESAEEDISSFEFSDELSPLSEEEINISIPQNLSSFKEISNESDGEEQLYEEDTPANHFEDKLDSKGAPSDESSSHEDPHSILVANTIIQDEPDFEEENEVENVEENVEENEVENVVENVEEYGVENDNEDVEESNEEIEEYNDQIVDKEEIEADVIEGDDDSSVEEEKDSKSIEQEDNEDLVEAIEQKEEIVEQEINKIENNDEEKTEEQESTQQETEQETEQMIDHQENEINNVEEKDESNENPIENESIKSDEEIVQQESNPKITNFQEEDDFENTFYEKPMTEEEKKKKETAAASLFSNYDDDDFW